MDKLQAAQKIGSLETEVAKAEAQLREHERRFSSAKGNRTAGAAALLIGIIGLLFLSSFWWLWAFLGIIGALTLLTAISKQGNAKKDITSTEARVAEMRGELAELRAQLVME
jgi:hypothetical protein